MLRVGLTGGMASGKSTVAGILHELGAFVSQSDEIARAMMEPGEPVFLSIQRHFGKAVLQEDGRLDRRVLARMAFDEGRVEELNALVHPPVISAQNAWMRSVGEQEPNVVVIVESALLLETRHEGNADPGHIELDGPTFAKAASAPLWRNRFDRIVLVTAPEKLRRERYIARALASDPAGDVAAFARDAGLRLAAQMPEEQKAALADVLIVNDASRDVLRRHVESVFRDLQAQARQRHGGER